MDDFFFCTIVCWKSNLHVGTTENLEHNGAFLYLKRAATRIMQLSLSLRTVNNGVKKVALTNIKREGGVIIVPECEYKDTE